MPYDVFFSYRRADYGAPMKKLFDDLSEEIRKLRGLPKTERLTFFDQESIETGDNWDTRLLNALQESKVLIPLYSPAYFKSEYCAREWSFFQLRRQTHTRLTGQDEPPVIRPIIWVPTKHEHKLSLPAGVSAAVKRVQYTWKDEDSPLNQEGLEHVVRLESDNTKLYWDFVRGFADELVNAIETYHLAPLADAPKLMDITPAFAVTQNTTTANAAAVRPLFRRHVRFVFAALPPQQLQPGRSQVPYLDLGGSDWKPFFPSLNRRIGALAAHIVSDADLEYDSDYVEIGHDLENTVRQALQEGKTVVVFVDRWSLYENTEYQNILRRFDEGNFANCAVLLPWNPDDPELAANRHLIDTMIEQVLHFRSQYAPSSPYYCKSTASVEELRQTLHTVLNQLQIEMRRTAQLTRPIVNGPARPIVTGPGA